MPHKNPRSYRNVDPPTDGIMEAREQRLMKRHGGWGRPGRSMRTARRGRNDAIARAARAKRSPGGYKYKVGRMLGPMRGRRSPGGYKYGGK